MLPVAEASEAMSAPFLSPAGREGDPCGGIDPGCLGRRRTTRSLPGPGRGVNLCERQESSGWDRTDSAIAANRVSAANAPNVPVTSTGRTFHPTLRLTTR